MQLKWVLHFNVKIYLPILEEYSKLKYVLVIMLQKMKVDG